ncbi:hypothetical protein FRB91_005599 [Serendipita sp. 411]|nr:hypothetical protein FRB91_005599 [Serendipita sp. 411]
MRKLHIDFESKTSREGAAHELRALEVSRSGDTDQMGQQIAALQSWLSSRTPSSRSSLSTVVELMHLLMEATAQLNEALERAQADEKTTKQQSELVAMRWSKEKERLQMEIEAYKHAIGRQRERLMELESQPVNPPDRRAAPREAPDVAIPNTPVTPAPTAAPSLLIVPVANDLGLQPPRPHYASSPLPSPISPATRSRKLPSPNVASPRTRLPEPPVGQTKSLSQHEPSTYPNEVRSSSPASRLRINGALHGPRERAGLSRAPSLNGRPPGAAPSAFLSENRPAPSSTTHEFSPYLLPEMSAAVALPRHSIPGSFGDTTSINTNTTSNNAISSRRTSMPHFSYAEAGSMGEDRKHDRISSQPSAWRHDSRDSQENNGRRPSHPHYPSADFTDLGLSQYTLPTSSSQSQSHPYSQTSREVPVAPDTPTLSRKRALRRTRDFSPAGLTGLSQY